jgi:hypothetical protein
MTQAVTQTILSARTKLSFMVILSVVAATDTQDGVGKFAAVMPYHCTVVATDLPFPAEINTRTACILTCLP